MNESALLAISPIDGRYHEKTRELQVYFSEFAIIKYRIHVEIEYFIALYRIKLPQLTEFDKFMIPALREIVTDFSLNQAERIKEIERITNHDVKAVEYFLREEFTRLGLVKYLEWIHFGLTSQDINNTAFPLALRDSSEQILFPAINQLIDELSELSINWMQVPMLAHTHGQPASPTRLGKEILVFSERLRKQTAMLRQIPFAAKFGGATGNFNAHFAAFPQVNWPDFADAFVNQSLNLNRTAITTQIEPYDFLAAYCDNLKRINTILIDFCRDAWMYISMEYFRQKVVESEVGSSAMPHKVNPIDFENAEGNLGIANALLAHFSEKLPVSRLQRDLTDSTVIRNLGVPLSHVLIALKSCRKGVSKLLVNHQKLNDDLEKNWLVVSEAIQTILRRENYPDPYSALKKLTRTGQAVSQESIADFVNSLELSSEVKDEIRYITPFNYLGVNPQ
jgi:adenylosuccinate lyase